MTAAAWKPLPDRDAVMIKETVEPGSMPPYSSYADFMNESVLPILW